MQPKCNSVKHEVSDIFILRMHIALNFSEQSQCFKNHFISGRGQVEFHHIIPEIEYVILSSFVSIRILLGHE
jgi:hypothetical protein